MPSGGEIPYSTALKNLIKHEELGGEKLYNLYKKATLVDRNLIDPLPSYVNYPKKPSDGFVPTAGKLRNDIQAAEKKWGNGVKRLGN